MAVEANGASDAPAAARAHADRPDFLAMKLSEDDIVAATSGSPIGDADRWFVDRWFVDGASIDSRTVRAGQLFVAVIAERDGHDFVAAAADNGATAALVSRRVDVPLPQVVVGDTELALAQLGSLARDHMSWPVIGITGSVGKTTTKDLLARLMAHLGPVGWSAASFNNERGVPLTLLGVPDAAASAVIEMGARGPGHIAALCEVARPTVGAITAIGAAHTELFGSLDDVAAAKGELFEAIDASGGEAGCVVVNADDDRIVAQAARCAARQVTVSALGRAADLTASRIELGGDLRPSFTLTDRGAEIGRVRLGLSGRHNVTNALIAAAVALDLGVPADRVIEELSRPAGSDHRMDVQVAPSGAIVIDDTYNANPTSMSAALDALAAVDARRRLAVLGVMAEIDDPVGEHAAIAERAQQLGIGIVAVDTALYGVDPVDGVAGAVERLGALGPTDAVLVKASRVAALERVVAQLVAGDQVAEDQVGG